VKNYCGEKTIDVFGKATNYNSTTSMEKGGHTSFWPKLILHPTCPIDANSNTIIFVKPCGFYKAWYGLYDKLVPSCKHMCHLFV
jgi:hypothetical protein